MAEARKLEAKDADGEDIKMESSNFGSIFKLLKITYIIEFHQIVSTGFSDPYCMLGIVPISMLKPFAQRFAMFEGKIATAADVIPAKFIKSTSVKFNTLQPIWNEKFRLFVLFFSKSFLCGWFDI